MLKNSINQIQSNEDIMPRIYKYIEPFTHNYMKQINKDKESSFAPIKLNHKKHHHSIKKYINHRNLLMENALEDMIKISAQTVDVAQFLKESVFGENHKSTKLPQFDKKFNKNYLKNLAINQIEQQHANFFIPKIEVNHYRRQGKRSIVQPNYMYKTQMQSRMETTPASPQSHHQISIQTKQTKKHKTLPSHQSFELLSKKSKLTKISSGFSKKVKRSNTFLFNMPTKTNPKVRRISENKAYEWQDQLHENLNIIQQTNIKGKSNIKIQKDKLSKFLKQTFLVEIITSYYKCETIQTFKTIKLIVEDLYMMTQKQTNLITFFTYDINGDGFICQEDLYFFISNLPPKSKLFEDIILIVQFLRKNKLRSIDAKLPKKLLDRRQKTSVYMLENNTSTQSKYDPKQKQKHKNTINNKLFNLFFKNQQQVSAPKKQTDSTKKKYQINFDIFNLIFAQKKPVLIPEIIKKLTSKKMQSIASSSDQSPPLVFYETLDYYLEQNRTELWKQNMSKSNQLVQKARQQQQIFSKKF